MSALQKKTSQMFLAGACLAFGIPFLLIEIISLLVGVELFDTYNDLFGVLYISLHVLGGIVGGALVARHVEMKHITRSGIIVGLLAFLVQQIISFLFFGAGVVGDTYTLFALLGGSIMGALLTRQNRKKAEKEAKEKETSEESDESIEKEEEKDSEEPEESTEEEN